MSHQSDPLTHKIKWTREEKRLLKSLANSKLRKKWKKISQIIGTKSSYQCSYKYNQLVKHNKHELNEHEDVLMTHPGVKNFFDKKYGVSLNAKKSVKIFKSLGITAMSFFFPQSDSCPDENLIIKQNPISTEEALKSNLEFFKVSKPNFQNEDEVFTELWERGIDLSDSLKKESEIDEKSESNAKINYNNFDYKEDEMSEVQKVESVSINFAEMIRKGSQDEFLQFQKSLSKKDTKEFKEQFEKSFQTNEVFLDGYLLKGPDIVLNNLKFEQQKILEDRMKCIEIITKVLMFLHDYQVKSGKMEQEEQYLCYMTMLNLLSEINFVTSWANSSREYVHWGLELQATLLKLLITFAERQIPKH